MKKDKQVPAPTRRDVKRMTIEPQKGGSKVVEPKGEKPKPETKSE